MKYKITKTLSSVRIVDASSLDEAFNGYAQYDEMEGRYPGYVREISNDTKSTTDIEELKD